MRKLVIALLFLASCGKQEDKPAVLWVLQAKDPVCGMWIPRDEKARLIGTATWDNAEWFFCAPECRVAFLKEPTKYAKACECKKFNAGCECDHCIGKHEPCDCRS